MSRVNKRLYPSSRTRALASVVFPLPTGPESSMTTPRRRADSTATNYASAIAVVPADVKRRSGSVFE